MDECGRLDEIFGDDEEHQEELDSYSSNSAIEHVTIEEYTSDPIACDRTDAENSARKRKIIKIQNLPQNGSGQPTKLFKIDVNQSMKLKNGTDTTKPQLEKSKNLKGLTFTMSF